MGADGYVAVAVVVEVAVLVAEDVEKVVGRGVFRWGADNDGG